MSLFPVTLLIVGGLLTVLGFLTLFSKKFYNFMDGKFWKDQPERMSEKSGFMYNKARGAGSLIIGIIFTVIATAMLFA